MNLRAKRFQDRPRCSPSSEAASDAVQGEREHATTRYFMASHATKSRKCGCGWAHMHDTGVDPEGEAKSQCAVGT